MSDTLTEAQLRGFYRRTTNGYHADLLAHFPEHDPSTLERGFWFAVNSLLVEIGAAHWPEDGTEGKAALTR